MLRSTRPNIIYFLVLGFILSLLSSNLHVADARSRRHSRITREHSGNYGNGKMWNRNMRTERGLKLDPSALGLERIPVILIPGTGGSQLEARQMNPEMNQVKTVPKMKSVVVESTRKLREDAKRQKQQRSKSTLSEDRIKQNIQEVNSSTNLSSLNSFNMTCSRQKKSGWYRLWMDIWQLLPSEVECWADNMMLYFDESTGDSMNALGLEVRVPGWGSVESIEYVDPSFSAWILGNAGSYMAPFIKVLERWGYKRDYDLRGAPYDFRYGPRSQDVFFRALQHLIENTYYINGRKKVAIIGHSMGGLFATYFLNKQSQAWKDQFIALFTTINTPWEGSAYIPHYLVSGTDFGISEINPLSIRKQLRSYETSAFMLPSLETWGDKRVLIETPEKNYTAADYRELFKHLDFTLGEKLWQLGRADWDLTRKHPGVNMYCLYSTGIDTVESAKYAAPIGPKRQPDKTDDEYMYSNDGAVNYDAYYYYYNEDYDLYDGEKSKENINNDDNEPVINTDNQQPISFLMGDGDGTVNRRSLVGCSRFYNSDYPFHMRHYRNRNHNGILGYKRFYKQMRNLLLHL